MPKVWVHGYYRKDGTRVKSHWRNGPAAGAAGTVVTITIGSVIFTATDSGGSSVALKPRTQSRAQSAENAIPTAMQADFNKANATLVASGYRTILKTKFDTDCAAHSYGQVNEFFKSNPCRWLARAYIQIGDSEILVAISWVEMPSISKAKKYQQLIDTPGAGDVTELSRETTLYKKITYDGSAHTSGINGISIWNVQVKPIFPKSTAEITKILIDSRQ